MTTPIKVEDKIWAILEYALQEAYWHGELKNKDGVLTPTLKKLHTQISNLLLEQRVNEINRFMEWALINNHGEFAVSVVNVIDIIGYKDNRLKELKTPTTERDKL